ncbi:MAG: GFA family protein [Parvularculaceae bacterium]
MTRSMREHATISGPMLNEVAMPEKLKLPLTGGCQCGALKYELSEPPLLSTACHCTNCQRITASAFAVTFVVREETMSYVKGAPKEVRWKADSGVTRVGYFCPDCGVRIAHAQEPSNGFYSLRAGTLDEQRLARPAAHGWLQSKAAWFTPPADDLQFDRQPADYAPIAALWRERMAAIFEL